ncbi:hypothetical protein PI23P_01035 [Polaribacter irgensii 23-P]|uniref:TonB C-terminal domain-containing protein n=1 Tax=Polaribacter irgensii 23-P TaxID=313594 RepID=A4C2E4_9FLAO|nr:hypothetical protein [Polaribacter irgensii]EAR11745.1 hypothetical protein PI23P_01035 [Polaribacter irgensii 23-P]
MFLRVFSFLLFLIVVTSCNQLSLSKGKNSTVLDTIVDFSSVDTAPSFKVCDSIIVKDSKSECFGKTLHQMVGVELVKYPFSVQDSISEMVYVDVLISARGKITLAAVSSSFVVKEQLPQLDSILRVVMEKIPNVYAAIKRGIPVASKYRLPIKIELKE